MLLAAPLAGQSAAPNGLLPVIGKSYPGFEGHFLFIGTYIGSSDSVHIRMLLTTHGAPGWTEPDSTQRARIGAKIRALREEAMGRGSRISFLDYGSLPIIIEQRPDQSGFTFNGRHWDWAPADSLLVVDVDRIDGVGGAPEIRSVRIAVPFAPRVPYRRFTETIDGVVLELQSHAVAGPLLRLSPERR